MERKVVDSVVVSVIGEYGITRVVEHTIWNNGRVFGKKILYDVCLDKGEGDIVASFDRLIEARKWVQDH